MGLVTAGWMWRNVRYSILVIFIIAAIITPTTDILNMCMFAAPMVVLYLLSIGMAWLVHPKQRKARREKKLRDSRASETKTPDGRVGADAVAGAGWLQPKDRASSPRDEGLDDTAEPGGSGPSPGG